MTPTITRRSLVTIAAAAITGLTLILLGAFMAVSAQDISTWATPVPVDPDAIEALVNLIIRILLDIIRGIVEPVAVVIGR